MDLCGILMDQNCLKVLLVLTHLGIHTYTSSNLPISFFFQQDVNLDSFIPETDCSFLNILENDLHVGIGILIFPKRQK